MVRDRVNGSGVAISATLLALFFCVATATGGKFRCW